MELKTRVSQWAQGILSGEFVIFDFETTGLDSQLDHIIQVGIVDHTGKVILDTLVKPDIYIPPEATHINGITNEMVAEAPSFSQIYGTLYQALEKKVWVVYNLVFDVSFLLDTCTRDGLAMPPVKPWPGEPKRPGQMHCAMERYAAFWGEERWNGGYRWQRLTNACAQQKIEINGAHSAVGDCLMTLALLKKMAGVA